MPEQIHPERHTQNRVVALFTRPVAGGELGDRYLPEVNLQKSKFGQCDAVVRIRVSRFVAISY